MIKTAEDLQVLSDWIYGKTVYINGVEACTLDEINFMNDVRAHKVAVTSVYIAFDKIYITTA